METSPYIPSKDCANPWCRLTWHLRNSGFWKFLFLQLWYPMRYESLYAPPCDHPGPFVRLPENCMHCDAVKLLDAGKTWMAFETHRLWCKATRGGLDEPCPIHHREPQPDPL